MQYVTRYSRKVVTYHVDDKEDDDEADHGVCEGDVQVGGGQLHGQEDGGDCKDEGRVTHKPVGPVENRPI